VSWWAPLIQADGYVVYHLPVTLFLLLFLGGEINAVLAIDQRHASAFQHGWVIASLIGLPVLIVFAMAIGATLEAHRAADVPPEPETADDQA
jgi:hypothetical protein